MRIGVDLDDTICRTTEIVQDRLKIYSEKKKINPLDVMNNEDEKLDFFREYLRDIYSNAEIKHDVSKVLRRIRNRGNQIVVITARSNKIVDSVRDVEVIIKNWLDKYGIVVDEIIIDSYGEEKAIACLKNHIDLMIDDNIFNYKQVTMRNIPCLLFDDREKYNLKDNYVTSWIEVEMYIERNY